MKRLFLALEVPPLIASKLSMLRGGVSGARWLEQENFHITLRYFGQVDDVQERRLYSELEIFESNPLEIKIRGLGFFGSKKPRSIYAAIQKDSDLLRFQRNIERYFQIMGFEPEHRKFTPHITLARLNKARVKEVQNFCAIHNLSAHEEFIAPGFVLYSAKTSTGGGPYKVEMRYNLNNDHLEDFTSKGNIHARKT